MSYIRPSRRALRPLVILLLSATVATAPLLHAAIDAPVSPNAQPNVAQLMQFLDSVKGNHVISGQQEIAWSLTRQDEDFDYVLKTTGKTPAVRGFDFLEYVYSPSVRANQNATERAIAWSRSGGIVNFCCHMFMDTGSPVGNPQFYAPGGGGSSNAGTTFDITQAVVTGTAENVEYLAKLDIIATELKKLRDAGVVVVWRPFHEASGGWFWWSTKGAAPLKQAWRIMFDRFTVMHGLNNLIWCFNPTDPIATNLADWYPGDDVVDIISIDVYPSAGSHPTFATNYNEMQAFKSGHKLVTMSENGAIPDVDQMFLDGAKWSYFCTWNGFENDVSRNSVAFLKSVYTNPKVITLETLPNFYVANAWAITTPPQTQLVVAGSTLNLSVTATGTNTYQWSKDGVALLGATSATYTASNVSAAAAGIYTVTVTGATGKLTSTPAVVTVAPTDNGRIVNLSVRADAGTNERSLIVGFVMNGSATMKPLLIRAAGPSLGQYGVTNFLVDPSLTLNTTPAVVNNDWGSNTDTTAAQFNAVFSQLGAFPLLDQSKDAALMVSLPQGAYTATVQGTGGTTGGALAEIYDRTPSTGSRLVNISARSNVGGGSDLIAGFVVSDDSRTVLIRAVAGQTLASYGVTGTLPNPKLELYRSVNGVSSVYATNDDWSSGDTAITTLNGTFSSVGAFPLPAASHDSALLLSLPAGVYSVQVKSTDTSAGVALVEVYEVR